MRKIAAATLAAVLGCAGILAVVYTGVVPGAADAHLATASLGSVAHHARKEARARKRSPAVRALNHLKVHRKRSMGGYDRDRFGPAWLDADRNGCDTRDDILGMYLRNKRYRAGTHHCVVVRGTEIDKYTGKRLRYVRGKSYNVDIDHVVALGNAWMAGARKWGIKKRAALANDPLNLLPVDASANRQKGDDDASQWLPPRRRYQCAYVARQITVKRKFHLSVTRREKRAMKRVLRRCPHRKLIRDRWHRPVRVKNDIHDPGAPSGTGGGTTSGSGGVEYANCDEARAAGVTPLHKGDPGYSTKLDRDGDGVACE